MLDDWLKKVHRKDVLTDKDYMTAMHHFQKMVYSARYVGPSKGRLGEVYEFYCEPLGFKQTQAFYLFSPIQESPKLAYVRRLFDDFIRRCEHYVLYYNMPPCEDKKRYTRLADYAPRGELYRGYPLPDWYPLYNMSWYWGTYKPQWFIRSYIDRKTSEWVTRMYRTYRLQYSWVDEHNHTQHKWKGSHHDRYCHHADWEHYPRQLRKSDLDWKDQMAELEEPMYWNEDEEMWEYSDDSEPSMQTSMDEYYETLYEPEEFDADGYRKPHITELRYFGSHYHRYGSCFRMR